MVDKQTKMIYISQITLIIKMFGNPLMSLTTNCLGEHTRQKLKIKSPECSEVAQSLHQTNQLSWFDRFADSNISFEDTDSKATHNKDQIQSTHSINYSQLANPLSMKISFTPNDNPYFKKDFKTEIRNHTLSQKINCIEDSKKKIGSIRKNTNQSFESLYPKNNFQSYGNERLGGCLNRQSKIQNIQSRKQAYDNHKRYYSFIKNSQADNSKIKWDNKKRQENKYYIDKQNIKHVQTGIKQKFEDNFKKDLYALDDKKDIRIKAKKIQQEKENQFNKQRLNNRCYQNIKQQNKIKQQNTLFNNQTKSRTELKAKCHEQYKYDDEKSKKYILKQTQLDTGNKITKSQKLLKKEQDQKNCNNSFFDNNLNNIQEMKYSSTQIKQQRPILNSYQSKRISYQQLNNKENQLHSHTNKKQESFYSHSPQVTNRRNIFFQTQKISKKCYQPNKRNYLIQNQNNKFDSEAIIRFQTIQGNKNKCQLSNDQIWSQKNATIQLRKKENEQQSTNQENNGQIMIEKRSTRLQVPESKFYTLFAQLDKKDLGYLNKNNCAMESVSEDLRMILGSLFARIKFKAAQYSLKNFVRQCVQIVKEFDWEQIQSIFGVKTPKFQIKDKYFYAEKNKNRYNDLQQQQLENQQRTFNCVEDNTFKQKHRQLNQQRAIRRNFKNDTNQTKREKLQNIEEHKKGIKDIERLNNRLEMYLSKNEVKNQKRNLSLKFNELSKLL